jgi:hypothetical protein
MRLWASFGILMLTGWRVVAPAQVVISWPSTNTIVQRGPTGDAPLALIVCATDGQPINRVELKFFQYEISGQRQPRPVDPTLGVAASGDGWLPGEIVGGAGTRQVTCRVPRVRGGMYTVLARVAGVVSPDVDLGVGEVFAIAGQSNAAGAVNCGELPLTRPEFVKFFNLKQACQDSDPGGRFLPGGSPTCAGPTRDFKWYWGALGDSLAATLGVPVAFYQAAYGGSQIQDWDQGSQGLTTRFGLGQPYANLRRVLAEVARRTGLRAVLWHQGESDQRTPGYADALDRVIGKSRDDAGFPNLPWVIAQASYNNGTTSVPLIHAQVRVIGHAAHRNDDFEAPVKRYGDPFPSPFKRLNVFTGPNTDGFGADDRCDNVHFGPMGQRRVAAAWFDALTQPYVGEGEGSGRNFLANSAPLVAQEPPGSLPCDCSARPPRRVGVWNGLVVQVNYLTDCSTVLTAYNPRVPADPPVVYQGPWRPLQPGREAEGVSSPPPSAEALPAPTLHPNPGTDHVGLRVVLRRAGPVSVRAELPTGAPGPRWQFTGAEGENEFFLDVHSLASGLYLLRVEETAGVGQTLRWLKVGP